MTNPAFSALDLSLLIRVRVVVSAVLSMVFAGFASGLIYAWVRSGFRRWAMILRSRAC